MERQTGLFAFADTEEAAKARLKEIATFALDTLQEHGGRAVVDEYLTRHNVEWSEVPVRNFQNGHFQAVGKFSNRRPAV